MFLIERRVSSVYWQPANVAAGRRLVIVRDYIELMFSIVHPTGQQHNITIFLMC